MEIWMTCLRLCFVPFHFCNTQTDINSITGILRHDTKLTTLTNTGFTQNTNSISYSKASHGQALDVTSNNSLTRSLYEEATITTTISEGSKHRKETPEWIKVVDITQTVCSFVGFTANCVTFITLTRSSCGIGAASRTLLRHQSVIDAIICLMAAIMVLAPPMWTSGNYILNIFVCHVWHSQIIYWHFYLISVWNLVTVAIERFISVVKPLSHPTLMNKRRIRVAVILLHLLSLVMISLGFLQVRFDGTRCVSEYAFTVLTKAFYVYGFVVFFMWHFIPVILFIVLYSCIIVKLKGRVQGGQPKSAVIEKASKELTKTAIAVTIVFMISTSFDLWYYLLGRTGIVLYIESSPVQKAGVFLSIINICVNPFVYIIMMPAYRRNVIRPLLCKFRNDEESEGRDTHPQVSTSGGSQQTHTSTQFTDIKENNKF